MTRIGLLRGGGAPKRFALLCLKVAAGLMTLAVVAAGLVVARINAGPIPVSGVGQTIARALNERFGNDLHFALGGTSLVQHGFGPSLAVERLSVTGPNGEPILTAPNAEVSVDTFALLFGKIVPKRLEVFDVTLRAELLKNGNLAIAAAEGSRPFVEIGRASDGAHDDDQPSSAPAAAPQDLRNPDQRQRTVVMRKAAAGLRQFLDILTDPRSPIAAVDRLGIARGTLLIKDQETNATTVYRDLDLAFDKRRGATDFSVSAQGPSRRWSISAAASGRPGAERQFKLQVRDLTIDELKLAAGSRSQSFDTDAPLSLHLDIDLRADNSLATAAGGIELGAGFLRTDDPDFEPLFVNSIAAEVHWNGSTRRVMVDEVRYVEGKTHFSAHGELITPAREGEPWNVSLALAEPGLFAPDRKNQMPIPVEAGQLVGRLRLDKQSFLIDRLSFRPKGGGVALAGEVEWSHGIHARFGMSMDPTPVAVVERVWPSSMAAAVRAWVLNHFEAGTISDGTMQIDYDADDIARMRADRAPSDKSVSIDFKVTGGRVRYLDGVPPLDNVVGTAHITGRSTHLVVASATTDADGQVINLSNGSFTVENDDIRPVHATVTAHIAGSVEAITTILSRDALKPYASLPLDPATLHGQVEGDLRKALVLGSSPATRPEDVALNVDAKITDFRVERLIGKENLENATMALTVANGELRATGQGRLFGGATTFEITRVGSDPATASVGVTLDDAARAKLGLSSAMGISGPVNAHLTTTLGGDPTHNKAQVELDLSKASVVAAYLGLNKPAGRAAKVAFTLAAGPDGTYADPVVADVGSLQARGSVTLNAENAFKDAHFSSFKVSPGDDMKLDVTKNDDIFKLTIRGANVDARPFIKAVTSIPPNEPTAVSRAARAEGRAADRFAGFDIDLRSNLLTGFNREVMSGVDFKLSRRQTAIRQFSLQGRFGRNSVVGSMGSDGLVRINSRDAGALVSFIDLYKHMEGGTLNAVMRLGETTLGGNLEVRDFLLRDEPAIERLVATSTTIAPPDGNTGSRDIDAGAVEFTRLKVSFQRSGSHLDLRDAVMYGPQIGLSVDGWLDYSHDQVGMKGTFVPAYALNNLFSQIPVFGVFLGGKSHEGLVAITFNISGQVSQPTLSINPLSAIAPGFLRSIFGALDTPTLPPPDYPEPRRSAPSR